MNSSVEQLAVDDDDKYGAGERMDALRLAKEIFTWGPESRLLDAANLFYEFLTEDRSVTYGSELIRVGLTATTSSVGCIPDDPAVIVAAARRMRNYIKTGDLSESPFEAPRGNGDKHPQHARRC